MRRIVLPFLMLCFALPRLGFAESADVVRELQIAAIKTGTSSLGHWGPDAKIYTAWSNHTNRLIPLYTFGTRAASRGADLASYTGANSAYRSEAALRRIYGRVPDNTLNPAA